MAGTESFLSVFKHIFEMCVVENLSFTKEDIDEMPPFERKSYFQMIKEMLEHQKEHLEKQKHK